MNHYNNMIEQMKRGSLYLLTIISGEDTGEKMTWQNGDTWYQNQKLKDFWQQAQRQLEPSRMPYQFVVENYKVLAERLIQEPELVICGAGHVSQELAVMADYLEYPYIVIDDRKEFANAERFPGARECICRPFAEVLTDCEFSGNAYYIIVTRGHMHDLECLDMILKKPYGYVGMIGSRAKVKKAMNELAGRGHNEDVLEAVHAPIGLPIGGQTPKEIAISIIGEIIQQKYQEQPSSYFESDVRALILERRPVVLVRIIDKRGSAPRGIGSRMLVDQNGIVAGTIGGGKIEYEAGQYARQLMSGSRSEVKTYRLNTNTAASLGMWCGGEVDILFEILK